MARLAAVGCIAVGLPLAAEGTAEAAPGSLPANCSANIVTTGNQASVTVMSGCQGPNFWLVAWKASSADPTNNHPQTYESSTNQQPWTLTLPSCYWQLDFVQRSTPPPTADPGQRFIAGKTGGTGCSTPLTTTTVPVTTVPVTTTTVGSTTTVPSGATTTVPSGATTTVASTTTTTAPGTVSAAGNPPVVRGSDGTTPPALLAAGSSYGAPKGTSPLQGLLAFTGAEITGLLLCGAGLVAVGIAAVRSARSRRRLG